MSETILYPKMASVKAAAEQFGCSAFFIRRLCRDGKVRYTAVSSRRWLVNLDSLSDFFQHGDAQDEQPEAVNGIRRIYTGR